MPPGAFVKITAVSEEHFIRDNSVPAVVTITQEEWKGNKMQIGKPTIEIESNSFNSGIGKGGHYRYTHTEPPVE